MRRTEYLHLEVVPWRGSSLDFFRPFAAAKGMCMPHACNPTLRPLSGFALPILVTLHFQVDTISLLSERGSCNKT